MAAVVRTHDAYKRTAGLTFPRTSASLPLLQYRRSQSRAQALRAEMLGAPRQASLLLPQENYYGWLVNDRQELKNLF